jgi:hypothetical protein
MCGPRDAPGTASALPNTLSSGCRNNRARAPVSSGSRLIAAPSTAALSTAIAGPCHRSCQQHICSRCSACDDKRVAHRCARVDRVAQQHCSVLVPAASRRSNVTHALQQRKRAIGNDTSRLELHDAARQGRSTTGRAEIRITWCWNEAGSVFSKMFLTKSGQPLQQRDESQPIRWQEALSWRTGQAW